MQPRTGDALEGQREGGNRPNVRTSGRRPKAVRKEKSNCKKGVALVELVGSASVVATLCNPATCEAAAREPRRRRIVWPPVALSEIQRQSAPTRSESKLG